MVEVAPRVYIETRYPGPTLGLVVLARGMVLVDTPPCADAAQSWQHTVRAMNGSVPDRVLVFLDAHPDRWLGASILGGVQVMHEDGYQWLREHERELLNNAFRGQAWELCPTRPQWVLPKSPVTFTEHMVLYLGDTPVILHHKPGHHPGAVWLEVPHARALFVGDTVVLREPPFLAWADFKAWRARLQELREQYGDYTVIGGRDGLLSLPDDVLEMERLLDAWQERLDAWGKRATPWGQISHQVEKWTAQWPARSRKHGEVYRRRVLQEVGTYYRRVYLQRVKRKKKK